MVSVFRVCVFAVLLVCVTRGAEYPALGLDVYDPHANGMQAVDAAIARASVEHKRVMLMFGANWCPWCHRLNDAFQSDPALMEYFDRDYVLVKIDVNAKGGTQRNRDVVVRFDKATRHGLPTIVVLDETGRMLVTQGAGAWEMKEKKAYRRAAILEFFRRWAPPRA